MKLIEAEKLALQLMQDHNLIANDWKFNWLQSSRVFGRCNYGTKIISLSLELVKLNSVAEVTDTILHEIAHALTPGDSHGKKWKECCVKIGCRPVARFNDEMAISITNKYVAICLDCNKKHTNRFPIPVRCACNSFSANKTLLNWNERQITKTND